MCVIFFKPTGVPLPKHENIELMWQDNKDGLGLMWANGSEVYGHKCHTIEEWLARAHEIPRQFPLVGHFRTATHGGKLVGHSQPFPFPVKKKIELFDLEWIAPLGVAHNGVLTGFGESMWGGTTTYYGGEGGPYRVWKNGKWEDKKTMPKAVELRLSDTQDFLLFMSKNRALQRAFIANDPAVLGLMKKLMTSRWALLSHTGKVKLLGDWHQERGIFYSNLWWKPVKNRGRWSQNTNEPTTTKEADTTPTLSTTEQGFDRVTPADNFVNPPVGGRSFPPHTTIQDTLLLPATTQHERRGVSVPLDVEVKKTEEEKKDPTLTRRKLDVAKKYCGNWLFCTQRGKVEENCMVNDAQRCVYFEGTLAYYLEDSIE